MSYREDADDRREFKRHRLSRVLPIFVAGEDAVLGLTVDMSEQGIRIKCKRAFDEGARLELQARFPDPVLNHEAVSFTVEARWCRPRDDAFDVGFLITDIAATDASALAKFAELHAFQA